MLQPAPQAEAVETKTPQAFSPRAANLRFHGDSWHALAEDVAPPLRALELDPGSLLTRADLQLLNQDNKAFLDRLASLTPEDLQNLSPLVSREADALQQLKAACAAGAASYSSAFLPGKVLGNYLGLAMPGAAPYIYVVLACFLHAFVGENVGGGLRGNYGALPSPDAAASANYTTAMALLNRARVVGNPDEIRQCEKDLHSVTEGLVARMLQQEQQGTPLWSLFKDNPVLSAHVRGALTDETPYIWYTFLYGISGLALPFERAAMGQMSQLTESERMWLLASVDIIFTGTLGIAAGMLTVIGQNQLRRRLQHVTTAPAGLHSPEVRDSHLQRARERSDMLENKFKKLCELDLLIKQQEALNQMSPRAARVLLKKIARAMKTNRAAQKKEWADLEDLHSMFGRNRKAIRRGFAATVCGKPKNAAEFLNRSRTAVPLRHTAKFLGNTAALLPFAYYITYLGSLYAQNMAFNHLAPGNATTPNPFFSSPEEQQQYIQDGIKEVLLSSSSAGAVLIGAWWLRSATTPPFERALGRASGYVSRAKNAMFGAPPAQQSPRPMNVTIHLPEDPSQPGREPVADPGDEKGLPTIVVDDASPPRRLQAAADARSPVSSSVRSARPVTPMSPMSRAGISRTDELMRELLAEELSEHVNDADEDTDSGHDDDDEPEFSASASRRNS